MSSLGVEEALTSSVDIQRNPLNRNERECHKGSECFYLKHYESIATESEETNEWISQTEMYRSLKMRKKHEI